MRDRDERKWRREENELHLAHKQKRNRENRKAIERERERLVT